MRSSKLFIWNFCFVSQKEAAAASGCPYGFKVFIHIIYCISTFQNLTDCFVFYFNRKTLVDVLLVLRYWVRFKLNMMHIKLTWWIPAGNGRRLQMPLRIFGQSNLKHFHSKEKYSFDYLHVPILLGCPINWRQMPTRFCGRFYIRWCFYNPFICLK